MSLFRKKTRSASYIKHCKSYIKHRDIVHKASGPSQYTDSVCAIVKQNYCHWHGPSIVIIRPCVRRSRLVRYRQTNQIQTFFFSFSILLTFYLWLTLSANILSVVTQASIVRHPSVLCPSFRRPLSQVPQKPPYGSKSNFMDSCLSTIYPEHIFLFFQFSLLNF